MEIVHTSDLGKIARLRRVKMLAELLVAEIDSYSKEYKHLGPVRHAVEIDSWAEAGIELLTYSEHDGFDPSEE